jgi:adenylate kinase family enzyme
MENNKKLIIIRGNSGSGKSTVARNLQKKFGYGAMVISQDVVRREILNVKDGADTKAVPLLIELAEYGRKNCDVVILEGIMNASWYKDLFDKVQKEYGDGIHAYYFDIPFEETLIRHQQKPNCQEFGETEMRSWWKEKDFLTNIPEKLLTKDMKIEEIVDMVYRDVTYDFDL